MDRPTFFFGGGCQTGFVLRILGIKNAELISGAVPYIAKERVEKEEKMWEMKVPYKYSFLLYNNTGDILYTRDINMHG